MLFALEIPASVPSITAKRAAVTEASVVHNRDGQPGASSMIGWMLEVISECLALTVCFKEVDQNHYQTRGQCTSVAL